MSFSRTRKILTWLYWKYFDRNTIVSEWGGGSANLSSRPPSNHPATHPPPIFLKVQTHCLFDCCFFCLFACLFFTCIASVTLTYIFHVDFCCLCLPDLLWWIFSTLLLCHNHASWQKKTTVKVMRFYNNLGLGSSGSGCWSPPNQTSAQHNSAIIPLIFSGNCQIKIRRQEFQAGQGPLSTRWCQGVRLQLVSGQRDYVAIKSDKQHLIWCFRVALTRMVEP